MQPALLVRVPLLVAPIPTSGDADEEARLRPALVKG
jgi:hypothetical protein